MQLYFTAYMFVVWHALGLKYTLLLKLGFVAMLSACLGAVPQGWCGAVAGGGQVC
jgi:hypothetical protein